MGRVIAENSVEMMEEFLAGREAEDMRESDDSLVFKGKIRGFWT